ncbi:hypothetical protein [Antarcticirhabdus aurantiaca]|uniref:hypothetical protein n=1 Tax=Antarcticirhabdus aurantiaca TaxID=2606717 RepID=UPI00131CE301|nr:hypothetical protein [Antarcticirhabdus aurantiaca]
MAKFDDEAAYDVTLTRLVKVVGIELLPRDKHEMRGGFLNRLVEENGRDAVDTAKRL